MVIGGFCPTQISLRRAVLASLDGYSSDSLSHYFDKRTDRV